MAIRDTTHLSLVGPSFSTSSTITYHNNPSILETESPSPENKDGNEGSKHSRAFLLHKTGKQVLWRPVFAIGMGFRVPYFASFYRYRYSLNAREDFFVKDPFAAKLYDTRTVRGKIVAHLYPKEYRRQNLTDSEAEALRAYGARWGSRMSSVMMWSNAPRLLFNGMALADIALGEGGSLDEAVVTMTDTAACGTFIAVQKYSKSGSLFIHQAQEALERGADSDVLRLQEAAYQAHRLSKTLSYAAFGIQAGSGAVKAGSELYRYATTGEVRFSTIVDGGMDIGEGMARGYYNYYLVSGAKEIYTQGAVAQVEASMAGSTSATRIAAVKRGTDMLAVSTRVIPRGLLWTMRGFGVVGGAIAAVPSGVAIYEGITGRVAVGSAENSDHRAAILNKDERTDRVVSGALGLAASAAFIAGSILVTPAALTIGCAFLAVGMALLGAQTIYDEWDNWK